MKTYEVSITVDYDGKQRTLGYINCETREQAAAYFFLNNDAHGLGDEYTVREIEVVYFDPVTPGLTKDGKNLVISSRQGYGKGKYCITIKTEEKTKKEREERVKFLMQQAITQGDITMEEITAVLQSGSLYQ